MYAVYIQNIVNTGHVDTNICSFLLTPPTDPIRTIVRIISKCFLLSEFVLWWNIYGALNRDQNYAYSPTVLQRIPTQVTISNFVWQIAGNTISGLSEIPLLIFNYPAYLSSRSA